MRAISSFNREAGTSTFWCRAWSAFRTRVSISATGSVNLIVCFSLSHSFAPRPAENLQRLNFCRWSFVFNRWFLRTTNGQRLTPCYQDDFETPGISPRSASWRKHKRQMPNLRRNARGRPQNLQRLCLRVENFGFLGLSWCNPTPSFTRFAVVAKLFAPLARHLAGLPSSMLGTAFPCASTATAPDCHWPLSSQS